MVAFNLDTYDKYKMAGMLTEDSLTAFSEGVISGTVKPHYKSEEVRPAAAMRTVCRDCQLRCPL